jgi:hypothetical protein
METRRNGNGDLLGPKVYDPRLKWEWTDRTAGGGADIVKRLERLNKSRML